MHLMISLSNKPNLSVQSMDYCFLVYVDKTKREWPADLGAYGDRYRTLLLQKLKLEFASGPFFEDCYYNGEMKYTELP